jgi:hypothetical protein
MAEGPDLRWEALARALLDCAEQCEGVLRSLSTSPEVLAGEDVKRVILLAAAAMQAAATSQILAREPTADGLRLVIRYARQAHHALAGREQERALRLCADCCYRTQLVCQSALAALDETD